MVKKIKSWNWASIINSSLLIAFAVPILGYTKSIYDIAIIDHAFRTSDHNEVVNMRTELNNNNQEDKSKHLQFENDIINLKSGYTSLLVELNQLEEKVNHKNSAQ